MNQLAALRAKFQRQFVLLSRSLQVAGSTNHPDTVFWRIFVLQHASDRNQSPLQKAVIAVVTRFVFVSGRGIESAIDGQMKDLSRDPTGEIACEIFWPVHMVVGRIDGGQSPQSLQLNLQIKRRSAAMDT